MLRVVEMAVADLHDTAHLELTAVDDEADEDTAAGVAARLASDPSVMAVIGHKNSGPSRAAGPVYAAAGLAQLTQCSTDNSLSRSGWKTFFRLCADNERQAAAAADFAHSRFETGRITAVHDGTAYGRPLVVAFAERMAGLSGTNVRVIAMKVGQEDFAQVVDAIRTDGSGLVYIGATEVEGSKLTIAMREAGIGAQITTSEGGPHNPFPRLAGAAGEGSVHTYAGADPGSTSASRRMAERCLGEIGGAPSFAVECYDAVTVIARAVAGGASTRAEVRDAIARSDVEGLAGRIRFDAHGDRIDAPVSLWQIKGGRMVPLAGKAVG